MSATQKKVWQFFDVDVLIYLESTDYYSASNFGCITTEAGTVVSGAEVNLATSSPSYVPALFSYCYLNSGEINGTQTIVEKTIPGRKEKLILGGDWKYTMSIEHLYFDKDDELRLSDVLSSNQNLRIAFKAKNLEKRVNPIYHVLSRAKVASFNITGREADTITVSLTINAEYFYIL